MPFVETLWNQRTPIQRVHPYLSRDMQCEVAVIGGGLTGALCAWHLREAGHEVALFTRGAVGFGATSASSGILRFDCEDGLQDLMRRVGPSDALDAYRAAQSAVAGIERILGGRAEACAFARRPAVTYATGRREAARLRGDFELLARAGFNAAWLDRNSMGAMFSFPAEGAILYHAGAAEADPFRLTSLLVEEAAHAGMRVYEYTDIASVHPMGSGVLLKTGLGISVRAKAAVVATGQPPAALRPYVSSWRVYTISTLEFGAMQGWGQRALLRLDREGLDLRTFGESALVSGQHAPVLGGGQGLSARRKRDILRYAWLEDALEVMFPMMKGVEKPGYRFSALCFRTRDGLPIIGPVEGMPGVYTVCGYGQDGSVAGVIAGRLLAACLRGDKPAAARLYSADRL